MSNTSPHDHSSSNEIYTDLARRSRHVVQAITVKISIAGVEDEQFRVHCVYSNDEKLRHLVDPIITALQRKHYPVRFRCQWVGNNGMPSIHMYTCTRRRPSPPLTKFDRKQLIEQGLQLRVMRTFHHQVTNKQITCEYMKQKNSKNPMTCPIYAAMKEKYEFSEQNLLHLQTFTHFESDSVEKPQCKFTDECKAFVRCEQGGNRLDDQCHLVLYSHPPRNRNIKLAENVHAFILNTEEEQNHAVYSPRFATFAQICNEEDGYRYLSALIDEVIANGFAYDLCLECGKEDECKHTDYSILQIVDEKRKHPRHRGIGTPLRRDEMLALVLYTGCDCNYDLCKSQRNGDYEKWKWFDYCLWWAIWRLSNCERGAFSVWSGLSGVKLDRNEIECGYFKTYVSTSWRRDVAEKFMGGTAKGHKGMLIEFDQKYKDNTWIHSCDVSWISKFPDECEVLFARSTDDHRGREFNCAVVNDVRTGVQTVYVEHGKCTRKGKRRQLENATMCQENPNKKRKLNDDLHIDEAQ